MTGGGSMVMLLRLDGEDAADPPPPGTRRFRLLRRDAQAAMEEALRAAGDVALTILDTGEAWPPGHLERVQKALAGAGRLAVGHAGVIYPDLFDGLCGSALRLGATGPGTGMQPVNELAIPGLALAGAPAALLRALARHWQQAPQALLPHIATLFARDLHCAGWDRRVLPGTPFPALPAIAPRDALPPEVVRCVLEMGGLRHLHLMRD
jgi:hypothetical protein